MVAEPKRAENRDTAPETKQEPPEVEDQPSLPLYLAGLVVTLSGILAVTLTVDDQNLTVTTMLLTVIGFIFSIGCRYLRVKLRIAEILLLGTAAYVIYSLSSGQFDWHSIAGRSQLDIGTVFAWALTAWSWALVSDSLILVCALLSMASIGLVASVNLDGQVETCFIVFLFSSLFVMGQHLFLAKREQAPPADRQRGLGQLWLTQIVVVLVSAVLIFFTASAVVVPAEVIFKGASVSEALQGLATFQQAAKQNSELSGPNVSDDSDLEIGTGQGWGATTEIVAYVQPSDHQPHYWKARTYDQYTGAGWTSSQDGENRLVDGKSTEHGGTEFDIAAAPPNAKSITSEFDIRGSTHEFFYTGSLQDLTISRPEFQLQLCLDGHAELADNSAVRSTYVTTSTIEPDPNLDDWIDRLRTADQTIPPAVTQIYDTPLENAVTTPEDVAYFRDTVKSVISKLPANKKDQFDEVQALTDYVSHRAEYSLSVSPLPAGSDHVRAFLQVTRAGYCDMFASSLAVLVRAAGYPSRVVTGFAAGSFDGTRYDLRVMDKHAWTEVYFSGYGWVPFDATAGAATATTNDAGQKKAATLWARLRGFLTARGPIAPILIGAILLILGYIIKVEILDGLLRRLRSRQTGVVSREEIGKQYEWMVKSIGYLGLKRKASETPFEFAARAVPYLSEMETSLKTPLHTDTVETFTKRYTIVRYGDEHKRETAAGVNAELNVFLRNAQRARLKRVLRRLRPGAKANAGVKQGDTSA